MTNAHPAGIMADKDEILMMLKNSGKNHLIPAFMISKILMTTTRSAQRGRHRQVVSTIFVFESKKHSGIIDNTTTSSI
jgi:hypothetical protein